MALKPDDTAALHETYKGFKRWFSPSAQDLYLARLDPVLDDRMALRALIRKVVRERQPAFEEARFIADAIGESESAFESLQAWIDHHPHPDFRKYWQTWNLPYSSMRTLPGFKRILVDGGIVDYWRATGKWGDFCKPIAAADFECR